MQIAYSTIPTMMIYLRFLDVCDPEFLFLIVRDVADTHLGFLLISLRNLLICAQDNPPSCGGRDGLAFEVLTGPKTGNKVG